MKNSLLLLLTLAPLVNAFGCEINLPDRFNLASTPEEGTFYAYSNGNVQQEMPVISVNNCSGIAMGNKYLMIALGPQNQEFSDRVGVFDFTGAYDDSGCKVENSLFKTVKGYGERKAELDERWRYIKSCVEVVVEDDAGQLLNMPEKQPGCEVKKISKSKMSFNGGFCFIKPTFEGSYSIKFNLKEECKTYPGLRDRKITVSDIQSILNFYAAGDASGSSIDLSALSTLPVRISVSPNQEILRASDNFGLQTPQFPLNYAIPDTHLGKPEATSIEDNRVRLRLPFWVDNTCERKCVGDQCQSICDYAQPVVGNIEFYEYDKKGNKQFLTSWYEGGAVQPHYQGEISGLGADISKELLKEGQTYHFQVLFNDPKFDYERFKDLVKQKIRNFEHGLGTIGRGNISDIPGTPTIVEGPKLPEIPTLTPVGHVQGISASMTDAMNVLRNYLDFRLWPPFLEKICAQDDTSRCEGIKDDYLELMMDFKVGKFDPETKQYQITVLNMERKSRLLPSYKLVTPKMPEVVCPY